MPSTHQNTVLSNDAERSGSRTIALPSPAVATIRAISTTMLASAKTPKSAGASRRAMTANRTKVMIALQTERNTDHSDATNVFRFKPSALAIDLVHRGGFVRPLGLFRGESQPNGRARQAGVAFAKVATWGRHAGGAPSSARKVADHPAPTEPTRTRSHSASQGAERK